MKFWANSEYFYIFLWIFENKKRSWEKKPNLWICSTVLHFLRFFMVLMYKKISKNLKFSEIFWDFLRFYEILWDFMNFMRFYEILWSFMKSYDFWVEINSLLNQFAPQKLWFYLEIWLGLLYLSIYLSIYQPRNSRLIICLRFFSWIFRNLHKFSEIFKNIQKISEIFRNIQRFSEILRNGASWVPSGDFLEALGSLGDPFWSSQDLLGSSWGVF